MHYLLLHLNKEEMLRRENFFTRVCMFNFNEALIILNAMYVGERGAIYHGNINATCICYLRI